MILFVFVYIVMVVNCFIVVRWVNCKSFMMFFIDVWVCVCLISDLNEGILMFSVMVIMSKIIMIFISVNFE